MLLPLTKLFSSEVRVFGLLCRSTLPRVRSQSKRNTFRAEGIYKNPEILLTKVRQSQVMCNSNYYQEGEARSLSDEGYQDWWS